MSKDMHVRLTGNFKSTAGLNEYHQCLDDGCPEAQLRTNTLSLKHTMKHKPVRNITHVRLSDHSCFTENMNALACGQKINHVK